MISVFDQKVAIHLCRQWAGTKIKERESEYRDNKLRLSLIGLIFIKNDSALFGVPWLEPKGLSGT